MRKQPYYPKKLTDEIYEKLWKFYGGLPKYIEDAGKTFLVIRFGHEWDNSIKPRKITIKDVIDYYKNWSWNISSGCRQIAGFTSDWRFIDNIAKECLEWFKFVNVEALRRAGKKAGLEPKF